MKCFGPFRQGEPDAGRPRKWEGWPEVPRREYEPEWGGDARTERCLGADLPSWSPPPCGLHCNSFAKNCVTRLIASARASGFEPTVGECPSGASFTFVLTVSGRSGWSKA
jgi:hypothetical protein